MFTVENATFMSYNPFCRRSGKNLAPVGRQKERFFMRNKFYLKNSPLWEIDYSWEGFSWISNDDYTQSVISFRRKNRAGDEIICVCNFVPVSRSDYRIGVPIAGNYKKMFSSADEKYGGSGGVADSYKSEATAMHGYENSVSLDIPALSVTYYKVPKKRKSNKKTV